MERPSDDNMRDLANSPAWDMVMEPLIAEDIELWETKLENADPDKSYAFKEVWKALRRLRAAVNIYKE